MAERTLRRLDLTPRAPSEDRLVHPGASVERDRYGARMGASSEMDSSLQKLVTHIEAGIAKRAMRTLFEETLRAHWPKAPQKQAAAIQAFAKAHGWAVAIHGQGHRATFTKL